jgi:cell division protein FtsB
MATAVATPAGGFDHGRRNLAGALVAVVVLVVLAVPTRSYLAQRGEIAQTRDQLAEVRRTNAQLKERKARLTDPSEVQRTARREFGLVGVGEESYSILPPATAGLVLPNTWPFDRLAGPVARAATKG